MKDAILIFLAQGSFIYLLGIQSLSVNLGHKWIASFTSFLLGISGFYVTGIVADAYKYGLFSMVGLSFIFAGPIAIFCAISSHPFIRKYLAKKESK
jgi:hypothetical protein